MKIRQRAKNLILSEVLETCIKTKPWFAKIAELNSFSPPVSRNSTQKKGWLTSQNAAQIAENYADKTTENEEKCMMRFVQNAARILRYHLNLSRDKKSIAKIALQKKMPNKLN